LGDFPGEYSLDSDPTPEKQDADSSRSIARYAQRCLAGNTCYFLEPERAFTVLLTGNPLVDYFTIVASITPSTPLLLRMGDAGGFVLDLED